MSDIFLRHRWTAVGQNSPEFFCCDWLLYKSDLSSSQFFSTGLLLAFPAGVVLSTKFDSFCIDSRNSQH